MIEPPFDYTALFLRYKGLAKELPFTKEHVELIRGAAHYWQPSDGDAQEWDMFATNQQALRDLADLISALLPKESQ